MIQSNFPTGGSGGGTGLALAAVTGITTLVASGKVYVKWTDPDDIVVAGSTLAAWSGTLLVRKAGSMPVSRRDGTVVLDSKTRNAYKNAYFCDSGLTDGTTYYYKFFPYTTTNTYTEDEADEFTAMPAPVAPANVSGMSAAAAGNGKLGIKWTDPAATVVEDGVTLATWASTKVVVKAGSYATDPDDANAAWSFNSTTRNAYASTELVATGLTNGTTYYVSFFPISTDGGVNVNASNRITGTANRKTLSGVPAQSGTLTYNTSDQSPSWDSKYDSTKMTLGGTTVGKNAGEYTATFTPNDDYMWSGGSTAAQSVKWKIGQATGTLTVSKTSISLDKTTTSTTFTIGGNHDGDITVTSSDETVAKVSRNGNTVTVSSVNNTTGSATITVKCAAGTNYTAPANKTVSVTAKFVTIYGVTWDGTSTTKLSRTDAAAGFTDPVPYVSGASSYGSPFDDLLPWSGMKRVTDSAAGELVEIPKFWYKITQNGAKVTIQIADGEVDGYSVSPAHMNRGDGKGVRDVVYVGRYHCASTYKSATGVQPVANITRSSARDSIKALGTGIWQSDFAMRFTIWLLYIVEFADWNSQDKIGYGCGNNSAKQNMGYTDSMPYHTGTTQTSRTTYGLGTQYRYIEGLWDNCYDWMDGCYYASAGLYLILNPSNFSDTANGTLVGLPTGGYPSALTVSGNGGFTIFYPTTSSGSTSTYIPDNWNFGASYPCLRVGGSYGQSLNHGLFCVNYSSASGTNAGIGCRLMKLP